MFKKGRRVLLVSLFIVLASLLYAFSSYAIVTTENYGPAIAYDDVNNHYLMVFTRYDGSDTYIYGQIVSSEGTPRGDQFVISDVYTGQGDISISAAYDGVDRRFLIVWKDLRDSSSAATDIYGQIVDADGTLSGESFVIPETNGNQEHLSVTYDRVSQKFLVAWEVWQDSLSNGKTFGQFVTSDGMLNGKNFVMGSIVRWSGHNFANEARHALTINRSRSASGPRVLAVSGIVLSSITPDPFGFGDTLTLSGSGFGQKKRIVMFGNTKAKIITWSDTSITCSLPKGLAGTYPVTVVIKKVGQSNTLDCTLSSPVLNSMNPSWGNPKDSVTIAGNYVGMKKPRVQFISTANKMKSAKVVSYSDTGISITVPKVSTGTYQVIVQNGAGVSNAVQFNVGTAPPTTFTLTVQNAGSGSGRVTSSPAGINCGSTCSENNLTSGTQITLTATPDSGSTFANWSGCDTINTDGTCTVTMSGNKNVTATFNGSSPFLTTYTLTVQEVGNGTGNEEATDLTPGTSLNCPGGYTCTATSGAQIAITAYPDSGSTFAGWSGCDSTNGATCTVTMNTNRTVIATYNVSTTSSYTLTVQKGGSGSGKGQIWYGSGVTCSSTSNGATCTCPSGSQMSIVETPNSGSTLAGWSGCDSVSTDGSICSVTMHQDRVVTVTLNTAPSCNHLYAKVIGGQGGIWCHNLMFGPISSPFIYCYSSDGTCDAGCLGPAPGLQETCIAVGVDDAGDAPGYKVGSWTGCDFVSPDLRSCTIPWYTGRNRTITLTVVPSGCPDHQMYCPSTGTCADVQNDLANCYFCGHVCPSVPHGTAGCVNGACTATGCNPGWESCTDPCDTDITSDLNNCGGCGNVCPRPTDGPGTYQCVNGACLATSCAPGYGNCDPAQGLCVFDTTSDSNNCGSCGNNCGNCDFVLPNICIDSICLPNPICAVQYICALIC